MINNIVFVSHVI